jgi:hypothetical protein
LLFIVDSLRKKQRVMGTRRLGMASPQHVILAVCSKIDAKRGLRLSALGLRRDPHGYVKQIHHEELEDGEKERPSAFPKIMLKQTDSRIQ